MNKMTFAAPIVMAALIAVAPLAQARDDEASAAALGFLLGTLATQQTYVYDAPPAVVYEPPRVVVQVPDRVYEEDSSPPPVYYYGSSVRSGDRGHHEWHHRRRDEYRHWKDQEDDN